MVEPTPNPVLGSDVPVLLALLGRYEGLTRGGGLDEHSIATLGRTCVRAKLIAPAAPITQATVADVLSDINKRLRYAIGEYASDPTASPDDSGRPGQT